MPKAPVVIHQHGRPMKAKDVDGRTIEREDRIYLPLYKQWFNVLEYDSHFVYVTDKIGSASLMCTCGSAAAAVGYSSYKQYSSFKGIQAIACLHYTSYGTHADGSH